MKVNLKKLGGQKKVKKKKKNWKKESVEPFRDVIVSDIQKEKERKIDLDHEALEAYGREWSTN